MSRAMSVLEGSYRLTTITKAKKMAYTIQIITLISLTLLLLIMGGMSLSPFYMPIDSFMYFMLIMLLVIMVEGFLFRVLEIRFTKSGSKKFLMAKNTIKKSMLYAIIAMIFAVILFLPFTASAVEGTLGDGGTLEPDVEHYFKVQSRDPLGLTQVTTITITMSANVRGYVYLLEEENWDSYTRGDDSVLNESIRRPLLGDDVVFDSFPPAHENLYVVMTSPDATSTADVAISTSASPTFFTLVPIMLLIMVAFSAVGIIYMKPMQKIYSESSIYK